MTANVELDALSSLELKLYQRAESLSGPMEQTEQQLLQEGVFDAYKEVHRKYLELFERTTEPSVKLESLKRLKFLNWYAMVEPSCFTGISELGNETMSGAFAALNDYVAQSRLDEEFTWMLSYYSSWDDLILHFTEPEFAELTAFIKSVDNTIPYFEQNLASDAMNNRGQMGIYWQSVIRSKS